MYLDSLRKIGWIIFKVFQEMDSEGLAQHILLTPFGGLGPGGLPKIDSPVAVLSLECRDGTRLVVRNRMVCKEFQPFFPASEPIRDLLAGLRLGLRPPTQEEMVQHFPGLPPQESETILSVGVPVKLVDDIVVSPADSPDLFRIRSGETINTSADLEKIGRKPVDV